MKVAVVGAGLAGLAICYYLLEEGAQVTLFDKKGIGGGASSVCSGLLHPYPGLSAKRSHRATDALIHTKALLRIAEAHTPHLVAQKNGILRCPVSEEQRRQLRCNAEEWGDVEELEGGLFMIHTGITVYPDVYLQGLWSSMKARGAQLLLQQVESLSQLGDFDVVVVACGWGVRTFPECASLALSFVKGQTITMRGEAPYAKSYIENGYIAHLGKTDTYDLGSTYERGDIDDQPDIEAAKALLAKRHPAHLHDENVLSCKAGVRVSALGSYLPIAEQLADGLYVYTGLGSRGLLYHALYASILSKKICLS